MYIQHVIREDAKDTQCWCGHGRRVVSIRYRSGS